MLLGSVAAAQSQLHLKSPGKPLGSALDSVRQRDLGRNHRILQTEYGFTPAALEELRERGVKVLRYVPDGALLVSGWDDFAGEQTSWQARPLQQAEKISALVSDITQQASAFVVEFHPDVEDSAARGIVLECGLDLQENPNLVAHQLLVKGTATDVTKLAEWDEVAYIFPASEELVDGYPVSACAGPLTDYGPVGQYVARFGSGWDGTGKHAVTLGYSFDQTTDKLPVETVRATVLRALSEWSSVVQIRFTPVTNPLALRSLNILFAAGAHGDAYPFDGPGGVLAHTFYPAPVNPEPLAGDLHLDADEPWQSSQIDLYSVVLHELGHALGLGHSDLPGAVMYPYYRRLFKLTSEDTRAIQDLYLAVTPESPKPTDPVTPPPAQPAQPPAVRDTVAPTITITSPGLSTVFTSAASIVVHGTARDNVAVTEVKWTTNLGPSGKATGTAVWDTTAIPLIIGTTTITVRAFDAAGNSGWRSLSVTRR
jgi:hypothetical protein